MKQSTIVLQNDYKDMFEHNTSVPEKMETHLGDLHSADTLCHQVFMDGGKLSPEARRLKEFHYGVAKINMFWVALVQFVVYEVLAPVAFD